MGEGGGGSVGRLVPAAAGRLLLAAPRRRRPPRWSPATPRFCRAPAGASSSSPFTRAKWARGRGGEGGGGGLDGQRGWRWAAVGLRRRAGGGRRAGHAPPLAFDTRAPGHQARHPLRGLSGPGGEGGREWGGSLTASAGGVVAAAVVVASV